MRLTILQWQMLLHYRAIAEPYALRQPEHANSQAVREQKLDLIFRGLLREHNNPDWLSGFQVTDKGRCLIEHICNDLPEPISITKWRMPD